MLYSKLVGKTEKNAIRDATATSHKLMYRAGLIRQVAAGRYAYLPLGQMVINKIQKIIENEMQSVGSQQIDTPTLQPIELWKKTNRDSAFGAEMHIVEDHHGATFAMGATAEGLITELISSLKPSYKELPMYVHQFSSKFRDEKRPQGGLLRVREFIMKDAYSFDISEEALHETYQKFYEAYVRISKRFGLKAYPVLADSGAIGGDYNHEFIVESSAGEGEAFLCDACDYAAHIDRAESGVEEFSQDKELKEVKEYWNDEVKTCALLAQAMKIPIYETTKTILFETENGFVAAMVRGDYDVNEAKLKRYLKINKLELAKEEDVERLTGAKVGFAGPVNLSKEVKVVADLTCQNRTNFEAGGNKTGLHLYNLNYERDFPTPQFADIRVAAEGDTCPACKKGQLKTLIGIEFGHCFKLDQFYSKPHDGYFTDKDGTQKHFWMGSYGIGLGRAMATIVETNNDEKGIIWPEEVAPFKIHLVVLKPENNEVMNNAQNVYSLLQNKGFEVLMDDREAVSAGAKFADADLLGIPYRLVISEKTGNKIEIKKRSENESKLVELTEIIDLLSA